jgi:peptidyl-prolyl cis-trans isomerase-like 3
MANKGPDTNGSQFFVLFSPQHSLDGKNTVFGKVIDGWDTLDKLEEVKVDGKNRPVGDKIVVSGVSMHANPLA